MALKDSTNNRSLLRTQKQYDRIEEMSIEQAIDVDTKVISFGKFMPGKMLGSTLLISNISKVEQIVEISLDNS